MAGRLPAEEGTPREDGAHGYRQAQWKDRGISRRIDQQWRCPSLPSLTLCSKGSTIIAEDDKFWSHEGFDFEAIQKAVEKDLRKKKFQGGGSDQPTAGQNLYLSPAKSPVRKLKEAIPNLAPGQNLSKRRIIELYHRWPSGGRHLRHQAAARHCAARARPAFSVGRRPNWPWSLPALRLRPGGEGPLRRPGRASSDHGRRGVVIPSMRPC